jgi:hypothetical protein
MRRGSSWAKWAPWVAGSVGFLLAVAIASLRWGVSFPRAFRTFILGKQEDILS